MQNRRTFIRRTGTAGALLLGGGFPFSALAGGEPPKRLTILHTNDVHSRLEPFPADGGKFAGQGGVAARAALIAQIRREEEHVLLFDSGDIFQGTPYFNLYHGEPEMKAMSLMGYDATAMGNHDFDAGLEGFLGAVQFANFPVLAANYDFSQTVLNGKTQPYKVVQKAGIKIGVFGLGISLRGLVPEDAYGKTQHIEPIQTARSVVEKLRRREGCDMVVCLSHLGFEYEGPKVSDKIMARETEGIDLILGGHTHTFMDEPVVMKNRAGRDVAIHQVGWAGVRLGRLDFTFVKGAGPGLRKSHSVIVGK